MTLEVLAVDPTSSEGRAMFAASSEEQVLRYGRDGGRQLDALARDAVAFCVARLEGRPVGCGALVPLEPGVGELSRIFVSSAARRRGVGRAIMAWLEAEAAGRFERLVLETGTEQPESIRLYEGCGYRAIPCWGKSADNPRSRCYEKLLATPV